jgi:hypothetical protein
VLTAVATLLLGLATSLVCAAGAARYLPGQALQGWQAAAEGHWVVIPPWDAGEDTIVSVEVCAGGRIALPLAGALQDLPGGRAGAGSAGAGVQATLGRSGGALTLTVDGHAPGSYMLRLGEPAILGLQAVVRVVDCSRGHAADYSRAADDPFPLVPRPGEAGYEAWLEEVSQSLPGWDEMARSLEQDLKRPQAADDTAEAEAYLDSYRALMETERELMRLRERHADSAIESASAGVAPGAGSTVPKPGDPDYEAWLDELAGAIPPIEQQIEELQRELGPREAADDTRAAEAMLDSYQRLLDAERDLAELRDSARPPGMLPVGWYQASEGGQTAESGNRSLLRRFAPPRDARYRPPPVPPAPFDWAKGGDGRYLILPRGGAPNADTIVQIRVCVGDTAIVPLPGSLDDEDLLPAKPSMEGVGGSLARENGQLVLKITPSEAGTHIGYLTNSDGGLVKGLRIEVHAEDCGKPAKAGPGGLGMPVQPVPGAPVKAGGEVGDNDQGKGAPVGVGAKAGGTTPAKSGAKPDSGEDGKKGVGGAVADGAKAVGKAAAGARSAGEGVRAGVRRGARSIVWPVSSDALGGMREGLARMSRLGQQAIALEAWSDSMRGKLPAAAQVVSFTTIDAEGGQPDIGGTTRIDLAALGVSETDRAEAVVNFISVDQSLKTGAETDCEVTTAENGDLVVEVPQDGERYGGILIQVGASLIALIADTPRRSPVPVGAATRPVGVADGSIDVAQGGVRGETVSGPGSMTDPAQPVDRHGVDLGGQAMAPVAVRDGEIAFSGEAVAVPADGAMDLAVTAPSGEVFSGTADAWGYRVAVPEVTERGATVDVTLELNGVAAGEAVTVTFHPQPGQEITPGTVVLSGVENGRAQPVAKLTTDVLGPQGFGVEAERVDADGAAAGGLPVESARPDR